jgi:hypothetical protein
VPALLGCDLILEDDGGHAGRLEGLHGAGDVEMVAVAGVGVGDHRHRHGPGDLAVGLDDLGHRDQPEVGVAEEGVGDAGTGRKYRLHALLDGQPGEEGVGDTGDDHDAGSDQTFSQLPS